MPPVLLFRSTFSCNYHLLIICWWICIEDAGEAVCVMLRFFSVSLRLCVARYKRHRTIPSWLPSNLWGLSTPTTKLLTWAMPSAFEPSTQNKANADMGKREWAWDRWEHVRTAKSSLSTRADIHSISIDQCMLVRVYQSSRIHLRLLIQPDIT